MKQQSMSNYSLSSSALVLLCSEWSQNDRSQCKSVLLLGCVTKVRRVVDLERYIFLYYEVTWWKYATTDTKTYSYLYKKRS